MWCKVYSTRKNPVTGNVYLHIEDDDQIGVKKLTGEQFDFAKKFKNLEFLNAVAKPTDDRDFNDSYDAIKFEDPDIVYSDYWAEEEAE